MRRWQGVNVRAQPRPAKVAGHDAVLCIKGTKPNFRAPQENGGYSRKPANLGSHRLMPGK